MRIAVDRCTCCGRVLDDEEMSRERFREVGFETLCERCFSAVYASTSSPPKTYSHSKHSNRGIRQTVRRLVRAFVRLESAALKAGVIATVALIVVGMLQMHKTGCFRRTPPPLRKRMSPSERLPPLVRFLLRENPSSAWRGEEHPSPAKNQTPQKAATEIRQDGKTEKSKPTVVAKAERRLRKRNRATVAEKRDFLPVEWADLGKRVERRVSPAPDERKVKEVVGKDAMELLKRIEAALKKGRRALLQMQAKDGIWRYGRRWMWQQSQWDYGCTALALWALLAAGEPRTSKAVQEGFEALRNWQPGATYTAALVLLAIEAYCREKGTFGPKFRTTVARNFKKGKNWLKGLAKKAANYLIRAQLPNGFWTYSAPRTGVWRGRVRGLARGGDASNTQFAMLGLNAACSLGIHVPKEVFRRNLKAMLAAQEKDGSEYTPLFFVPAAEMSIKELRRLESAAARRAKSLSEFNRRFWKTMANRAARKDSKKVKMCCRGFGYLRTPGGAYLAMTAAGVANLVIAKSRLSAFSTRTVNSAIRDAAAWIARALDTGNTGGWRGRRGWNRGGTNPILNADLYTLLSLERAGVFTVLVKFGKHDWYRLGAEVLLKKQRKDGSWGEIVNTSFALLFLARGVAGVVGTPGVDKVIRTGKGFFKGR